MQVIVGAGTIGSAVAKLLVETGEPVTIVSRSGSGPVHPLVNRVALDATDPRLRSLAEGASVIYNCANPQYYEWPTAWPPISRALIDAAAATGAVLAITGNLYGYGPVDRPMTEDMPLRTTTRKGQVRIKMWQDALAAPINTLEVRASDYLGPTSSLIEMALPSMRAGKTTWLPGALDVPHTYTYVGDVARTLVTLATDRRAWGKAWHVPSPAPMTSRELLGVVARHAGLPAPKLRSYPLLAIHLAGLFDKFVKEFLEVRHQHVRPFIMDSSRVTDTFGLRATDVDTAVQEVLDGMSTAAGLAVASSGGSLPVKSTRE